MALEDAFGGAQTGLSFMFAYMGVATCATD